MKMTLMNLMMMKRMRIFKITCQQKSLLLKMMMMMRN